LLSSQAAKALLHELRDQYDYVIVDSPPLLAVTDAAVLAVNSDGAIMMTRYGATKRDQLTESVRILKDVGATLLGTVLTMTPLRGRGTYSYRYSYYGYGEDSGRSAVGAGSPADAGDDSESGDNNRIVSRGG